ncbi:MAG: metallophosphoesterase [Oscillospiraceae bacterium]
MSIFAIGDTHLSFGADKSMNIFRGWDNYVERLEKNWKSIITDDDTVVIMGDVSWAMSLEAALPDFKFIESLPGEKIILKGNHDYWWNTKKKMDAFFEENNLKSIKILHNNAYRVGDYSICGTRGWFFDAEKDSDNKIVLREIGRLKASIDCGRELGGEPIVFFHYPPVNTVQKCDLIYDTLINEKIKRCYYAHIHSASVKLAFNGEKDGIFFALLSSDYLSFCPKLIEMIKN